MRLAEKTTKLHYWWPNQRVRNNQKLGLSWFLSQNENFDCGFEVVAAMRYCGFGQNPTADGFMCHRLAVQLASEPVQWRHMSSHWTHTVFTLWTLFTLCEKRTLLTLHTLFSLCSVHTVHTPSYTVHTDITFVCIAIYAFDFKLLIEHSALWGQAITPKQQPKMIIAQRSH